MSMLQEVRVTNAEPPKVFGIFSSIVDSSSALSQPDPRVSGLVGGVPQSFIEQYAAVASRHAAVSQLEDGRWFAEVKGLKGAWGDGADAQEALDELERAIVGWAALRLEAGTEVPVVAGFDLNPGRVREQAS